MTTRIDLDEAYILMAQVWSRRSYAVRKKVGCLIVKNKMIISDGYNGTPTGSANVCEQIMEDGSLKTIPEVSHAEANALIKLAKNGGMGSDNATMYCTLAPCVECAKMIVNSGIKRFVYLEDYRSSEGIDHLKKYGNIEVNKVLTTLGTVLQ